MIRKTYKPDGATFKVVDEAKGIVSGIVNSTGIVDAQKDNMVPGCWKRIAAAAKSGAGKYPVICREHDWNRKVGKGVAIEELDTGDPRLGRDLNEQGAGGLLLTWQYNMATQAGRDAFEDVKFLKDEIEFSVGFFPAENAIRYDSKGVRHISDVERLPEVSDVLVGASVGTFAASVKRYAESSPEERKARTADRLARAKAMVEAFKGRKAHFEMDDGKYQIETCADVEDAWGLRNSSNSHTPAQVVRHIRHAASELGCDGPWNDGSHDENGEETGKSFRGGHLLIGKPAGCTCPAFVVEGCPAPEHRALVGRGAIPRKEYEEFLAAEKWRAAKASHSHYHVHPDGTAHTHAHGHGPDVAEHDGPAEKVPHQHGHPSAEDTEPKAQLCCDDCKGADCAGCCADCCHGAGTSTPGTTAGKAGGLPGDPPGVPYMTDDEAQHNGPLMQLLDALNTLIVQEAGEGGYTEYGDIIRLCCLAQDAISWAAGEANEYGDYGMYSIWDLFAAGKEALSSKTETEPAEKAALTGNVPMPPWLKAAILASSEADLTSSHHPNPAEDGGGGPDWERTYVDRYAGFALGTHVWLQRDLQGEPEPQRSPADVQDEATGPPDEWAERFTSPWRQQQP